jgi:RNA 2',3'-cyclic 3'-phosphodiesterase
MCPATTTMPESTRVFIAIAVPERLEQELVRLQAELAPAVPSCRWTSALPFHLTLAFLGDVPNGQLCAIDQVVASSAGTIEPFEIGVTGLGAFPSTLRPRVIWAGTTASNMKPLQNLQESIVNSLARIGYPPDDRRFSPHVSLGRIKHQRHGTRDLTGLIERHRLWSAGQYIVADVHVFASTLGPTGSAYRVLSGNPLGGKKTEGRP